MRLGFDRRKKEAGLEAGGDDRRFFLVWILTMRKGACIVWSIIFISAAAAVAGKRNMYVRKETVYYA